LFCTLAIFNVREGPVPSDNFSMLVPKWKTARQKPAISPVSGATKPCLVFGKLSGGNGALAAARPEGTIVVVGGGRAGLDPLTILVKELRLQGCFTYVDEFTETDGGLQVADLTFRDHRHRRRPRRFRATPGREHDEDLHRTEWFVIWRADQPSIARP
jgi:hypothetical protein